MSTHRVGWLPVTLLFGFCSLLTTQAEEPMPTGRVLHSTTMLGLGGTSVKDTYLSPQPSSGISYSLLSQQSWLHRGTSRSWSHLSTWWLHYSPTQQANKMGRQHFFEFQYTYAFHYRLPVTSQCRWLIGGGVSPQVGFIYNNRNGNNPMNAHVAINAQLSTGAVWQLPNERFPLRVAAYLDVPLLGVLFSPVYGQSYYDLWQNGIGDAVHFASLHNQWAIAPMLVVEIPFRHTSLAIGYRGHFYAMQVADLVSQRYANAVMIGLSGDFVRFGGRRSSAIPNPSPASP